MLRSPFFDDPFFSGGNEHMRQMDPMFNGFGMMGNNRQMALPGRQQPHRRGERNNQVAQQGMFMDPFAQFNNMFANMHSMMTDMRSAFNNGPMAAVGGGGNSQVFQQSSFMSYSNTGDGAPKIYQATSSSKQGPDGVRETRRTLRDSEAGMDKIAVGHHIRDRGHVIERSRNRGGDMNENQEYINLDEEEAEEFDREYRDKWQSTMRGIDQRRHAERSRHAPVAGGHRRHAALPEPEARRERRHNHRRE